MTVKAFRDLRRNRAAYCYSAVCNWHASWRKEATTRVKSVAIQIRTQGLLVTLATLMAEAGETSSEFSREQAVGFRLADSLADWLLTQAPHCPLRKDQSNHPTGARQLLTVCAQASRATYSAAQREAILFFDQLKVFADALEHDATSPTEPSGNTEP